jgi:hypothetical protein
MADATSRDEDMTSRRSSRPQTQRVLYNIASETSKPKKVKKTLKKRPTGTETSRAAAKRSSPHKTQKKASPPRAAASSSSPPKSATASSTSSKETAAASSGEFNPKGKAKEILHLISLRNKLNPETKEDKIKKYNNDIEKLQTEFVNTYGYSFTREIDDDDILVVFMDRLSLDD